MIGPLLPPTLKRRRESTTHVDEPMCKRQKRTSDEDKEEKKVSINLMHPRNIYRNNPPNYHQLSLKYAFFNVVKQNNNTGQYYINYNDPKSNMLLTKVLLLHDFGLRFEHPMNHLCPPITQRLNYILWIQDLLQYIPSTNEKTTKYHGFDIGVGASCVFPLLGIKIGHKQNESWSFTASDVDSESIQCARNNVKINNLNHRIQIVQQSNPTHIFKGIIDLEQKDDCVFDFTVCNPPFFEHLQETRNASSINATHSELVYHDGGEVGFITLLINEIHELKLYHKIQWFTTMLGKKSSIKPIEHILNKRTPDHEIPFVITTQFVQGKQVRWGLAWTYQADIKHTFQLSSASGKQVENEFLFDVMARHDTDYNECLANQIEVCLKKYGIKYDGARRSLHGMYNESKNKWIQMEDINSNGFAFSMKWIIKPNTACAQGDKIKLSVILNVRHHDG
eukprot:280564_1